MKDYSNSQEELRRLEKLRVETARDMAEKKRLEKMAQDKKNISRHNSGQNGTQRRTPFRGSKIKDKLDVKDDVKVASKLAKEPWRVMRQIGKDGDGLYLVIGMISLIMDVTTFISGGVEGVVTAITGWIPFVGQVVAGTAIAVITRDITAVIIGAGAVNWLLYLLAGHYKHRRKFMKIAVLVGFEFTELMPIASALPGFVASFLINYFMVLTDRAMEEIKNEEVQKKIKATQLFEERKRRQQLIEQKAQQQFAQTQAADDYQNKMVA